MKTILATLLILPISSLTAGTTWKVVYLHPKNANYSIANCTTSKGQGGSAVLGFDSVAALWQGSSASYRNFGRGEVFAKNDTYQFGFSRQKGELVEKYLATAWKSETAGSVVYRPELAAVDGSVIRASTAGLVGGAVWYANSNGRSSAAIWDHPLFFNDRNPPGATSSAIYAMSGAELSAGSAQFDGPSRAILWIGPNPIPAVVDVHPEGAGSSEIFATNGTQHAGYIETEGIRHAAVWTGNSPGSIVDLHPPGMGESVLTGISRAVKVGYVDSPFPAIRHAALWLGAANQFVDLHSFLRPGYTSSAATGVWADKTRMFISGSAYNATTSQTEAILWKWDPEASPVLNLTGPRLRKITGPGVVLRGSATDVNGNLKGIEVKVGNAKYKRARGRAVWSFAIRRLPIGPTVVWIRAIDQAKTTSKPLRVRVLRRR